MRTTRWRDEIGTIAIELPLLAPVLILLIVLVARVGMSGSAQLQVDDAAREAARAASLSYTADEARALADSMARASLDRQGVRCTRVAVEVDTTTFRAGGRATANVRCSLSLPVIRGLPSGSTVHARATEVVDLHRSVQ